MVEDYIRSWEEHSWKTDSNTDKTNSTQLEDRAIPTIPVLDLHFSFRRQLFKKLSYGYKDKTIWNHVLEDYNCSPRNNRSIPPPKLLPFRGSLGRDSGLACRWNSLCSIR